MTLYKIILEEYMQTTEGRNVTRIFENFSQYIREKKRTLFKFLIDTGISQPLSIERLFNSDNWKCVEKAAPKKRGFDPVEDARMILESNLEDCEPREKRARVTQLPSLSLKWFICDNETAFPYFFVENFKAFRQICDELDIEIPAYSANPTNVEKRVDYYFELCDILKDFRERHEMSPIELCVFIYGYGAQNFVKSCDVSSKLIAHKAFYTIAFANQLNNRTNSDLIPWCVPKTMNVGDLAFMYEEGEKCIRYICQARTEVFRDPFEYWGLNSAILVILAQCPRISREELMNNQTLGNFFRTSSRLRGPAGKPFSIKEYEALLQILEEKGFPVSDLPKVTWED